MSCVIRGILIVLTASLIGCGGRPTVTDTTPPATPPGGQPRASADADSPKNTSVVRPDIAQNPPSRDNIQPAAGARLWIADLASSNEDVRTKAEQQVLQLGDQATGTLLAAMKDKDEAVRRGAAFHLLERFDAGSPQIIAAFTAALSDDSRTVRHIALQGVKKLSQSEIVRALPQLSGMLDPAREEPANRGEIARLIGSLGADARPVLPALSRAAREDPDEKVRAACLYAVSRVADPSSAVALFQQSLKQDTAGSVRRIAAYRLGRLGPAAAPAVAELGRALEDRDSQVRRDAADALSLIGPMSVPVLIERLDSPNARTRELAVYALGKLGPLAKPAAGALEKRLADEDKAVRDLAEAVLPYVKGTP
jgi:HEAT repeat protein